MSLKNLREKVINEFLEFTSPARTAAVTGYAALSAAMLYAIAAAGGPEAVQAIGLSLGNGVLTSLLASHLYDTKDAATRRKAMAEIERALREQAEVQGEIHQALSDLRLSLHDLSDAAREACGLTDEDRAWLRDEFAELRRDWQAREEQESALRNAYLNHLLKVAGRIDLFGIDRQTAVEEDARRSEVEVGAIYVPLRTSELEEDELSGQERNAGARVLSQADDNRARNMISAIAQLDRRRRLVLLGDPGSGKSTFAKFVACCLAGEALEDPAVNLAMLAMPVPDEENKTSPENWSHGALLPVMVELRKFAALGLPPVDEQATCKHLWEFIARELDDSELGEYAPMLRTTLRRDGGLLLLDGLDEVPEADRRRRQILDAIEDFAAAFPSCRLLVTSRTYAYLNQQWRLHDFHEAMLMPFDRPQVDAFIDRWYAQAVITRHRTPADAEQRAQHLKEAIKNNDRIFDLAGRPLILTLITALHDWREGDLPEKRWQLYEETVDLLLERWNKKKTYRSRDGQTVELPNLAEWLKVDRGKVRLLLNRLAYEAHAAQADTRGTADIAEQELADGLFDLTKAPKVHPAAIIEFLQERAGILVAHGDKVYTFPHRTIQEYLAACHLTDLDDPDALGELVRREPDRWRETALLVCAKAGVWTCADALCPDDVSAYPCGKTPCDAWGALIAGLGVAESAILPPESRRNQRILTRLRSHLCCILAEGKLPVIERAAAGNVLATIGDPRFHGSEHWYLPKDNQFGFIEIPAGPFLMGNDQYNLDAFPEEVPRHKVTLPTYYLARFPVTAAQFRAFVEADRYSAGDPDCLRETANHPVVMVSWQEAMDYCAWLNRVLHEYEAQSGPLFPAFASREWAVTLPSEAEWEKAARGVDARKYPWGNKWDVNCVNSYETGINTTNAVGCFPGGRGPYGIEEMSGNVWEWTRSKYVDYPYKADERESSDGDDARVLRGGSWYNDSPWFFRAALRYWHAPGYRFVNFGFRCVVRSPGP